MKRYIVLFVLFFTSFLLSEDINSSINNLQERVKSLEKSDVPPIVERYILDELKSLRTDLERVKTELHQEFNRKEIAMSDKAINYSTSTLNNIFYIITASTSLLVFLGWSSFRDIKEKVKDAVNERVSSLIKENEQRLANLEEELDKKYRQVIKNREEISKTNAIQSLYMRAGLEESLQVKIEIYDKILTISPENPEVLSYKADAVLELGEPRWALNLANRAIDAQNDYANGYYQRACVHAELNSKDQAIKDLYKALNLNENYIFDVIKDRSFDNLRNSDKFISLINRYKNRLDSNIHEKS